MRRRMASEMSITEKTLSTAKPELSPIKLLVPDLPDASTLMPWLERIDAVGWYTNSGPLLQEFEALMAGHWMADAQGPGCDLPAHVVALNNGTTPLELGIQAMHPRPGGTVLLPSFTFPATGLAVLRNQLSPLFCDVAEDNWQLSPASARLIAARQRLALVMPVTTFGCPVNVDEWDDFVADTGIPVLIDGAASFGNQALGSRVSLTVSLHATKPFGIGEGGLFVTRDSELAGRVRRLANFGFENGEITQRGTNAKLSEYAAAVSLAQWQRWPALRARRQALWSEYHALLAAIPRVAMQGGFADRHGVSRALPAALVLRLPAPASAARDLLAASGIETRRWYCPPLHRHPIFAGFPITDADGAAALPVTELLGTHSLGLPWHGDLDSAQMQRVGRTLSNILEQLQ